MKRQMLPAAIAFLALGAQISPAVAQEAPRPAPAQEAAAATPEANPEDVKSIDAILAALYDTISGPPGPRNWTRLRSLFAPNARMGAAGMRPDGTVGARLGTVQDYIDRSGPFLEKQGFFEREIARETDAFGPIAHVFSTYEARHAAADAKPFMRGINSIQLYNDGKRWYVVNIFWTQETEKNPIPQEYLPSRGQ